MYHYSKVAVLCAQRNGVYSRIFGSISQLSQGDSQDQLTWASSHVGIDVYCKSRDAFSYKGGVPVVAHPPCRLWGKLKGVASVSDVDGEKERELGRFCVQQVIENGGVLEHPAGSKLFEDQGLPLGGYANEKGFTLELPQRLFGHPMVKNSWFFFAGLSYDQIIPVRPLIHNKKLKTIEQLSAYQRESTPLQLAEWLLVHASLSSVNN